MSCKYVWLKLCQIIKKKALRKNRLEYRQVQTQQLEMHRYDNAKSYWKLLNEIVFFKVS